MGNDNTTLGGTRETRAARLPARRFAWPPLAMATALAITISDWARSRATHWRASPCERRTCENRQPPGSLQLARRSPRMTTPARNVTAGSNGTTTARAHELLRSRRSLVAGPPRHERTLYEVEVVEQTDPRDAGEEVDPANKNWIPASENSAIVRPRQVRDRAETWSCRFGRYRVQTEIRRGTLVRERGFTSAQSHTPEEIDHASKNRTHRKGNKYTLPPCPRLAPEPYIDAQTMQITTASITRLT